MGAGGQRTETTCLQEVHREMGGGSNRTWETALGSKKNLRTCPPAHRPPSPPPTHPPFSQPTQLSHNLRSWLKRMNVYRVSAGFQKRCTQQKGSQNAFS